jgi:hypothetical protein
VEGGFVGWTMISSTDHTVGPIDFRKSRFDFFLVYRDDELTQYWFIDGRKMEYHLDGQWSSIRHGQEVY